MPSEQPRDIGLADRVADEVREIIERNLLADIRLVAAAIDSAELRLCKAYRVSSAQARAAIEEYRRLRNLEGSRDDLSGLLCASQAGRELIDESIAQALHKVAAYEARAATTLMGELEGTLGMDRKDAYDAGS